ncbi:MAG TPA: CCA tRNA nucleotidyltransferase [Spirochaetia bacterium]|nr:CCA tRNA nucleotidyltransferase [Spirochaetia bacterium]
MAPLFHSRGSISPPRALRAFARVFHEAGYQCFLVGGALRNIAMGSAPSDWDIATDATPDQVSGLFRRVIPTGAKHGTVTVLFKDEKIEVTTFRTEAGYSDSRHPDSVAFSRSIHEDLKRRDFTMNGMALDLASGEFVDPHNGLQDIQRRTIRAIGDPTERFSEDALRVLRALRFAAQLDFEIEEPTFNAIQKSKDGLIAVSAERIRDELIRILQSPIPSRGLLPAEKTGVLELILPELHACAGVEQADPPAAVLARVSEFPYFDVLHHSLLACDGAPAEVLEVRMAALLHDIGKAPTFARDAEGVISFHHHEELSAQMAEAILARLRFPTVFVKTVCRLIRNHMFHYEPEWSDAAVRRFIARSGADLLPYLYLLRRADTFGKTGRATPDSRLDELERRVNTVAEADDALSIADLAVNGNDLAGVGIPKGPMMGVVLSFLLETVLDDPTENTREKLLNLARAFYHAQGGGAPEGSGPR